MENDIDLLDQALAKGILTQEQRRQLEALQKGEEALPSPDERFRVVNGFGEIFVSIGLFMLFGALRGLSSAALEPIFSFMLLAGIAWFGAYYFTFRRRMLLPAILCCLDAAYYVGAGTAAAWWETGGLRTLFHVFEQHKAITMPLWQVATPIGLMFAMLVAAAWRFRIPFLMLPIGLIFTLFVTISAAWYGDNISYRMILGACGITMLFAALRFDFQDPQRQKRASDFAFWCYVIGSPLTVHPVLLTFLFNVRCHSCSAVPVIALMLLISLLISVAALVINRRALVLSTLLYVSVGLGYALTKLSNADTKMVVLWTSLIIGTYVVCLGIGWKRVRRYLMSHLTTRTWFAKLPPF